MTRLATPDSLWHIRVYEAFMPLLFAVLWLAFAGVFGQRARRNRAVLRRRRRAERELVRKLRSW